MKRLTVFDHRCLLHVRWYNKVSDTEVELLVLGKEGKVIDEVIELHGLRWLGHVLRISSYRFP